ncbi:MAG: DUF4249 family protein [Bacteroidetes bacterium]|nr:DUF4249 family protein [Bacteroidota bacterium]
MDRGNIITLLIALAMMFTACEKEITVTIPLPTEKIAVEGHIEQGTPPYVILTTNKGYFEPLSLKDYENLFVHDAIVRVSDGTNTITLTEYCLDNLDTSLIPILTQFLGAAIQTSINFCVYTTLNPVIFGKLETTYTLTIETDTDTLEAVTKIPGMPMIDSLFYSPHPNASKDSLAYLMVHYTDPDSAGDYARYFTKRNEEPFYPGFYSVFDDHFINGKSFDFPLDRGYSRSEVYSVEDYGWFLRGDTVIMKWCGMDEKHFTFWQTWEYSANSTGNPFSTPITISSNVKGGLGIWGGYAASYDTLIIPK